MIRLLFALALLSAPVAAQAPGPDTVWHLVELDGARFGARATLTFPEPGRIAGEAPCNRYAGSIEGDWPDLRPGPVMATRMACADLAAEAAFFAALEKVTQAMVADGQLRLDGPDGRSLLFRPAPQP